jgi:hypothetical protein
MAITIDIHTGAQRPTVYGRDRACPYPARAILDAVYLELAPILDAVYPARAPILDAVYLELAPILDGLAGVGWDPSNQPSRTKKIVSKMLTICSLYFTSNCYQVHLEGNTSWHRATTNGSPGPWMSSTKA